MAAVAVACTPIAYFDREEGIQEEEAHYSEVGGPYIFRLVQIRRAVLKARHATLCYPIGINNVVRADFGTALLLSSCVAPAFAGIDVGMSALHWRWWRWWWQRRWS